MFFVLYKFIETNYNKSIDREDNQQYEKYKRKPPGPLKKPENPVPVARKETVIARIHEAAKYVPLDRLYLSPQCGFASCEIGNKLTEEEQWAKLKLVKEIAGEVWPDR